jgi:hypothetical protein
MGGAALSPTDEGAASAAVVDDVLSAVVSFLRQPAVWRATIASAAAKNGSLSSFMSFAFFPDPIDGRGEEIFPPSPPVSHGWGSETGTRGNATMASG